jgi:hypothetical protein
MQQVGMVQIYDPVDKKSKSIMYSFNTEKSNSLKVYVDGIQDILIRTYEDLENRYPAALPKEVYD